MASVAYRAGEKLHSEYYAVRWKLLKLCPDSKYDQRLLDKEYAALEQTHAETYVKYKAIREEHQKIYHIHSCVEKGCHAEQTLQKKDHRKQEERWFILFDSIPIGWVDILSTHHQQAKERIFIWTKTRKQSAYSPPIYSMTL